MSNSMLLSRAISLMLTSLIVALIFSSFGEIEFIRKFCGFLFSYAAGHIWTVFFLKDNDDNRKNKKRIKDYFTEKFKRFLEKVTWKPVPIPVPT